MNINRLTYRNKSLWAPVISFLMKRILRLKVLKTTDAEDDRRWS